MLSHLPEARTWLLPAACLALISCGSESDGFSVPGMISAFKGSSAVAPMAEVDCGPFNLLIEQKEIHHPFNAAWHYINLYRMDAGQNKKLVGDLNYKAIVAARQLYPPGEGFIPFPASGSAARPAPAPDKAIVRDVFLDPAVSSKREYREIAACLVKNIKAIDAAIDQQSSDAYEPGLRLRAITHMKYDSYYRFCGPELVGRRFDCGKAPVYLKTLAYDRLQLCRKVPGDVHATNLSDEVGRILPDGRRLALRGPGSAGPADHPEYGLKALVGPGWKKFYGGCRDASGKTIYDYFEILPWQETKK